MNRVCLGSKQEIVPITVMVPKRSALLLPASQVSIAIPVNIEVQTELLLHIPLRPL